MAGGIEIGIFYRCGLGGLVLVRGYLESRIAIPTESSIPANLGGHFLWSFPKAVTFLAASSAFDREMRANVISRLEGINVNVDVDCSR